jgi:hypothetical protein
MGKKDVPRHSVKKIKKDVFPFFCLFMFIRIFINMEKQCSKCNLIKSENDFYKSQRGSKCKECLLEVTRTYKRIKRLNPEERKKEGVKQKERRFRLWQNTLVNDSKHRGLENTLTVNDINEMFNKQNGLCYWFKVPLMPSNKTKHPQQPSLDRLDRTKGYTKDNVVLCCYSANIGRNENDQETWEEFLKLLF